MKGFKKIFGYLKKYLESEFNLLLYLFLALFLAVAIWFNYTYKLEKGMLGSMRGESSYFFLNMLYYAVPYLIGCMALVLFYKEKSIPTTSFGEGFVQKRGVVQSHGMVKGGRFFTKPGFWLVLGIFCFSLSADSWFRWYEWIEVPFEAKLYLRKMTSKLMRVSFYIVPILLYYLMVRKRKGSFFGLTTKGFDKSPYIIMMLIMVPLLIWAAYNGDFLKYYPTYKPGGIEAFYGISTWTTFIPYELFYGLTFIALEILFRGFLIFEMEKYLGEKVVIPMVCVYCTLHFGKPMMECVSSIFGGFILGVIALRSRSVYGGVWVHIFIAIGMDLLAFLQKGYFAK